MYIGHEIGEAIFQHLFGEWRLLVGHRVHKNVLIAIRIQEFHLLGIHGGALHFIGRAKAFLEFRPAL